MMNLWGVLGARVPQAHLLGEISRKRQHPYEQFSEERSNSYDFDPWGKDPLPTKAGYPCEDGLY